ncbi:ankyrin repeat-containing domain protein [Neocallimastix sp. 'constans']
MDLYIDSFVSAIDRKDYSKEEELIKTNNENSKFDIIYEMLLDVIFNHIKIYDNEFIKLLLFHYRDKVEIPISDLNQYISVEKHKILTYDSDYQSGCGKYLLTECNRGKKINSTKDEFLVEYGTDINEKVEHGADVNKKDNWSQTPLFISCEKGNEAIVKYIVEKGTYVNKENTRGETLLFISCKNGNEAIVKCLVEHGANVNKANKKGEIPLFISCEKGNEGIVKYLVEHGADVNTKDNGQTPLFISCEKGNEAIVKYLVEKGIYVNKENNWGQTPLFISYKNGNKAIAKYLIKNGAEINKKRNNKKIRLK